LRQGETDGLREDKTFQVKFDVQPAGDVKDISAKAQLRDLTLLELTTENSIVLVMEVVGITDTRERINLAQYLKVRVGRVLFEEFNVKSFVDSDYQNNCQPHKSQHTVAWYTNKKEDGKLLLDTFKVSGVYGNGNVTSEWDKLVDTALGQLVSDGSESIFRQFEAEVLNEKLKFDFKAAPDVNKTSADFDFTLIERRAMKRAQAGPSDGAGPSSMMVDN
jgi:hypothetical protein